MLPKELTPEQQQVPDLTKEQLKSLGFKSNFNWKLNAKMLGYSNEKTVEEFIEEKIGVKIKTCLKGSQVTVHEFSSLVSLDAYPIAFEGELILKEKWEFENGEWRDMNLFSVVKFNHKSFIRCCIVPFGLTGRFQLVYGKTEPKNSEPKKLYRLPDSLR